MEERLRTRGEPRVLSSADLLERSTRSPWKLLQLGARLRSQAVVEELMRSAITQECPDSALHELRGDPHFEIPAEWDPTRLLAAALLQCVLDPSPACFRNAVAIARQGWERIDFPGRSGARALMLLRQAAALIGDDRTLERCDERGDACLLYTSPSPRDS